MATFEQRQADGQLVIEVLERTRDGRALFQTPDEIERHGRNGDGAWLKFLENACNGHLNARGRALLQAFHRQVLAGDYQYEIHEFEQRFTPEEGELPHG
jgi:hypothetical protein